MFKNENLNRWAVGAIIALAMLAGASLYKAFTYFLIKDPVTVISTTVINDPVPNGEHIIIEFLTERRRLCRSEADLFVLRKPENTVVWRNRVPTLSVPIGINRTRADLVEAKLEPGEYIFRDFVHSQCTDGNFTTQSPDVSFKVLQ
jgi:hypothetical protein